MAESRNVILFSTADWDAPYWTNKQHTARHLAALGFQVLYIESPGLRAPTANRKDFARILRRIIRSIRTPQMVEPGVWAVSTVTIPFKHHWKSIRTINQGWIGHLLRRFVKQHGFPRPIIWTYHPFVLESLTGLDYSRLVYHSVDDLSAIPGIDRDNFIAEERRLLNHANIVFTTSETLRQKYLSINSNTYYMPNVTDLEHFGRARKPGFLPEDLAAVPEPRIGFVGVLSDFKVDFALVLDVVRRRRDWHWVFIGEEREGQMNPLKNELTRQANTHFLGYKPYSTLPEYLRGISVGTLPLMINDYTRSMFPMKYYEYVASGIPVVATPLEFTRYHTEGLDVAADPASYVEAIARQLARGRLNDAEAVSFVGNNTWNSRIDNMLQRMGIWP
ncbi:MAG: glycosyltransferase [Desulfomonilaceae bacterium]